MYIVHKCGIHITLKILLLKRIQRRLLELLSMFSMIMSQTIIIMSVIILKFTTLDIATYK